MQKLVSKLLLLLAALFGEPQAAGAAPYESYLECVIRDRVVNVPGGHHETVVAVQKFLVCINRTRATSSSNILTETAGPGINPRDRADPTCEGLDRKFDNLLGASATLAQEKAVLSEARRLTQEAYDAAEGARSALQRTSDADQRLCTAARDDVIDYLQTVGNARCMRLRGQRRIDCMDGVLDDPTGTSLADAESVKCGQAATSLGELNTSIATQVEAMNQLWTLGARIRQIDRDEGKLRVEKSKNREAKKAMNCPAK